jgi:hypothetical protein
VLPRTLAASVRAGRFRVGFANTARMAWQRVEPVTCVGGSTLGQAVMHSPYRVLSGDFVPHSLQACRCTWPLLVAHQNLR